MPLPTRRHSTSDKKGVTLVHDTPYEAAYSAFRLALQEHVGAGVPCWVDDADIDIDSYGGDKKDGQANGQARYKTLTADGKRVSTKTPCTWSVRWRLGEDDRGLPKTELVDFSIN